jgi:hypothetical protein
MKLLLNDQPLYMPSGSVRSIIALAIVGAYIAGMVPIEVATLVLGFYFAARQGDDQDDTTSDAVQAAHDSHELQN